MLLSQGYMFDSIIEVGGIIHIMVVNILSSKFLLTVDAYVYHGCCKSKQKEQISTSSEHFLIFMLKQKING